MSDQYILCIDQGTTNLKVALVSQTGALKATDSAPLPLVYVGEVGVEQNSNFVWATVKRLVRGLVANSGVAADAIMGLLCVSQYSSIVPVDADGNPLMNMVMHMDYRGAPKALRDGYGVKPDNLWKRYQWLRINGIPPLDTGMDSVSHMRFIKAAHPDVYEKTAVFLEAMDFMTMKLTGRATANQCTALMMLGVDNRTKTATAFDPKLIAYSGIDKEKWPELVPVGSIVGTILPDVAAELGLLPSTKVIAGLNDTQTGGVATSAFKGSHAAISIGTTGVIITHVDFKRTDLRTQITTMPSPVPETNFVLAENGLAGKVVEFFLENLIYADDHYANHAIEERFAALDAGLAAVPPGSNGLLFLPWLAGSTAPVDDTKMRGGVLNMSLSTTRADMARAAVEGVTFNLQWLRTAVEKFSKRPFSHIVFYSGGALSREWGQIMADIFQIPIHQVADPDYAVVRGAAFLAFQRLGLLEYDDFEKLLPIRVVTDPRQEYAALYEERYAQFVDAFKVTRPFFKRISKHK